MANLSVGYDGTVTEKDWAGLIPRAGGFDYGVDRESHFQVKAGTGDRAVTVSPGIAWGRGVYDVWDTGGTLQLDAVASGIRWDLIAMRRDWQGEGGLSKLVVIKGTSAEAIPAARWKGREGELDDQPLALVKVQAGATAVQAVRDLRVFARNGGVYATDDLARSYVDSIGTVINVNGTVWQRTVNSTGTPAWVKLYSAEDTGWQTAPITYRGGWGNGYFRYRARGGLCEAMISFERTGGTLPISDNGDNENYHVMTVSGPAVPRNSWWHTLSGGPAGPAITGFIDSAGGIYLAATTPNDKITAGRQYSLGGFYFTD